MLQNGKKFIMLKLIKPIHLIPKDLYCDDKYCYTIKNGKMSYTDETYYSMTKSPLHTKYFMKDIY